MIEAKASFDRKPSSALDGKTPRPLFGAPAFNLVLPQARTRNGAAHTIHDLSDHPWAGAEVDIVLSAREVEEMTNDQVPMTKKIKVRSMKYIKLTRQSINVMMIVI